jgi:hypothetical protein
MSHPLIDLNEDLRALRDEGYAVGISSGNLVVSDIPYVTPARVVRTNGTLVAKLNLSGDILSGPEDHTIKFVGEMPHTSAGQPIAALGAAADAERVTDSLVASFRFSAKPQPGNYENYTKKVQTYVALITAHAIQLDPSVTALTRRVVEPEDDNSPFHYMDTASARAEINMITAKLAVERIAIVGLGGTGSYVLDLLAKTPATEIHLYDGDVFASHNAFRAPGAASKDELHAQSFKVDYFKGKYSVLHKRIIAHAEFVGEANVEQLRNMACVFLSMDGSPAKKLIVQKLEEFGVTFIDTGMGLIENNAMISGILQVTTSEPDNRECARSHMSFATGDGADVYERNIQVADLNALNAVLAVMKWKKLRGFYYDTARERQLTFTTRSNMLLTDDLHGSN